MDDVCQGRLRLPWGMGREVIAISLSKLSLAAGLAITVFPSLMGCRIEKPDPVASANAILHKHPSDFINQLTALDALAAKEAGLKVEPWMAQLYSETARLGSRLAEITSDSARVVALNSWFFDSLGMVPVMDSDELATSLPSQVYKEKKGSCLGLTLLYLTVAQFLKLPLYPVFLPGHVFVRYQSESYACNIETLRGGLLRSDSFYRETFFIAQRPWYTLSEGDPKQALAALVFNMANLHRSQGNWAFALEEYHLVEESLPGYPAALGNEGAGYLATGDIKAAEPLLLAAFKGDSLAQPARVNLAILYRQLGDSANAARFTDP